MDQKVFNEVWHQTIERLVEDLKWPLITQPLLFPVSKLSPIVSIPVFTGRALLTKEGVGEESNHTTARVPVSLIISPPLSICKFQYPKTIFKNLLWIISTCLNKTRSSQLKCVVIFSHFEQIFCLSRQFYK